MWKLLVLAGRSWRYVPRRHRRRVMIAAAITARRHGPTVARAAGRAVRAAKRPSAP
jgi:hypothetical protein